MLSSRFAKSYILKNAPKRLFACHTNGSSGKCPVHPEITGNSTIGCPYAPKTMVRNAAPDFKGTAWWNGEFKNISLESFQGKWVCLFFYPLNFTFVCPTEIVDFNSKAEEFNKLSKFNNL